MLSITVEFFHFWWQKKGIFTVFSKIRITQKVTIFHSYVSFHLILMFYTIFKSVSKSQINMHAYSLIQSCKNFRFACCFHNGWLYLPSVKGTKILNLSGWLDILDLQILPMTSEAMELVHVLALHNSFSFHLILVWQTILLFGCHIKYHITSLHSVRLWFRLAFFTQNLLVHSLKWLKPA